MAGTKASSKLVLLDEDEYDAIAATGRGRSAKPSTYAGEVAEALTLCPDGKPDDDKQGWAVIKGTAANPITVVQRELRKAGRQWNDTHPDTPIRVEARPRENHPRLGDFVAFRAYHVPVAAASSDSSEGDSQATE